MYLFVQQSEDVEITLEKTAWKYANVIIKNLYSKIVFLAKTKHDESTVLS